MAIPRRTQELVWNYGILWPILPLDLHLHPYKIQLTQQLTPADYTQRRGYVEWVLKQQAVDENFLNKIFFSDKAHFIFGEYVNKQNCRILGSEEPQVIEERPLYSEKVIVWCALWPEGVIGPYFFENDNGKTVIINSKRCGIKVAPA